MEQNRGEKISRKTEFGKLALPYFTPSIYKESVIKSGLLNKLDSKSFDIKYYKFYYIFSIEVSTSENCLIDQ